MAYALGLRSACFGRYEIGRSEPPFDIVIEISTLTRVDRDESIVEYLYMRKTHAAQNPRALSLLYATREAVAHLGARHGV